MNIIWQKRMYLLYNQHCLGGGRPCVRQWTCSQVRSQGSCCELRAHRIAKEKEEVTGSAHNTFLDPLLRASFTLLREDLFVLPDLLGMTFKLYSHLRIGMGKTYRNWHKRNFQCHTVEVIQRLSQPTQAVWKLCLTPHSQQREEFLCSRAELSKEDSY